MTWEDVLKEAKKNIPFSSKPKEERTLKKQHSILYSVIPSRDQVHTERERGDSAWYVL